MTGDGNAMLVIMSDGKILKKIEANQQIEFQMISDIGEYDVFLVGESAKVSVSYEAYNIK